MNSSGDFPSFQGIEYSAIAALSFNIILALPLNCCVIWLILTKRTLDTDMFSLNLALSEIVFCLCSLLFFVYLKDSCFECLQFYTFSAGLLFTARPLFQCCICMEYYVGVVHPVIFLKCKPLRYRMAFSCIAWLISLQSCVYSFFYFARFLYHYGFFVQNLLFLSVIQFCCLSVLKALKHPGPGDAEKKTSNKAKRKAFKVISLITVYMTISFFLYVGVIPLQSFLTAVEYMNALTICLGLALGTGFIQPMLYLHRSGKLVSLRKF